MQVYDRIVSIGFQSVTMALIDDPIVEITVPANGFADIIRVEIGPHEGATPPNPTPFAFYTATAIGAGGTALTTEELVRGDGTVITSGIRNLTAASGTGYREYHRPAINWSVGHLYLPVPAEMYRIRGGGQDFFGFLFTTAPSATPTLSGQIIVGEVSA